MKESNYSMLKLELPEERRMSLLLVLTQIKMTGWRKHSTIIMIRNSSQT